MENIKEQPSYYAILPATVRYDDRLKDKAKILYGEIIALTNKTGECWASNEYFANLYKITTRSVSSIISELEEYGYIKRKLTYKENSKEIDKRIISIPIENSFNTIGINIPKGNENIFQENNINTNNTSNNISYCYCNKEENLFDYIEENFGRTLNNIEVNKILKWKDTELTRYAIEQSVLNNKYSIGYIDGILRNFEVNNIKTIKEAEASTYSFKNNKRKTYKQRKRLGDVAGAMKLLEEREELENKNEYKRNNVNNK